jgi:hypothetical protein
MSRRIVHLTDLMAGLTERVERWREGGTTEEVLGRGLLVIRREGSGPLLLS